MKVYYDTIEIREAEKLIDFMNKNKFLGGKDMLAEMGIKIEIFTINISLLQLTKSRLKECVN